MSPTFVLPSRIQFGTTAAMHMTFPGPDRRPVDLRGRLLRVLLPVVTLVAIVAVITAILIALTLVLSTAGPRRARTRQPGLCVQTWPVPCNGQ
jgi:hypothetical protein